MFANKYELRTLYKNDFSFLSFQSDLIATQTIKATVFKITGYIFQADPYLQESR